MLFRSEGVDAMDFFGGYSKRGQQLKEQDRKFQEFQRRLKEEETVFEKGDYLAMVLGAFWALWPALAITLAVIIGIGFLFL